LWRKRRERIEWWSISNSFKTRKRLPYWKGLKNPRSQDLSAKKLPPEIRSGNGSPRRLEESNQRNTMEMPQLR